MAKTEAEKLREFKRQYRKNKNPELDISEEIEELKAGYGADFDKLGIKVGKVLGFDYEGSKTYLEIGRIEDGKTYAKEVELYDPVQTLSHVHHNVDATGEVPWCTDCEVPVTEPATRAGRAKYETRKERHLSDGTPIEEEPDEEQLG